MLSKILSIDQDNYPEMLGHTCIINAGGIVSILFRFVKPYLDIRTQNKIEVRMPWASAGRLVMSRRARASFVLARGAATGVLVMRQVWVFES